MLEKAQIDNPVYEPNTLRLYYHNSVHPYKS